MATAAGSDSSPSKASEMAGSMTSSSNADGGNNSNRLSVSSFARKLFRPSSNTSSAASKSSVVRPATVEGPAIIEDQAPLAPEPAELPALLIRQERLLPHNSQPTTQEI